MSRPYRRRGSCRRPQVWKAMRDGREMPVSVRLQDGMQDGVRDEMRDGARDGVQDEMRVGVRDGVPMRAYAEPLCPGGCGWQRTDRPQ